MQGTEPKSISVQLQQHNVRDVAINCGGMYIDCTTLTLVLLFTYILWSMLVQRACLYTVNPRVAVNCRSGLYINCTTVKLVVHIANTV